VIPRRRLIPIFIPHMGCPHDCLFCNQHTVAGQEKAPTPEEVEAAVKEGKKYAGEDASAAFYGGSFTCLKREEQEGYLEAAAKYVKKIRLSTRPDGIDPAELDFLGRFPVREIELGGQSSDDEVLRLLKRGHSYADTEKASGLIKKAGFSLGLQMMTGLPGSSRAKERKTAEDFISLKPDFVRIYPTLVLPGTALESLYRKGQYMPQTLEEAVDEVADLKAAFDRAGIPVIRMGLNETETLKASAIAGPYDPAFGELVLGRIWRRRAEEIIKKAEVRPGESIALIVEKGKESQMAGQKKSNILYLKEKFSLKELKINPALTKGNRLLSVGKAE